MDKLEFNSLLKKANLSKKTFSELVNLEYNSVANWGNKDKNIPHWVESWLDNYIKSKNLDELKSVLKKAGVCEG